MYVQKPIYNSVETYFCAYLNFKLFIPDPHPHQRIKAFLTLTNVSKLSEKWSGIFIPDPGSGSQIQGLKKHWIPDPLHWFFSNAIKTIDLEAMYAGGELFGEHRVLRRRGGEGGGDRGAGVAPRVQALVSSSPLQTYNR